MAEYVDDFSDILAFAEEDQPETQQAAGDDFADILSFAGEIEDEAVPVVQNQVDYDLRNDDDLIRFSQEQPEQAAAMAQGTGSRKDFGDMARTYNQQERADIIRRLNIGDITGERIEQALDREAEEGAASYLETKETLENVPKYLSQAVGIEPGAVTNSANWLWREMIGKPLSAAGRVPVETPATVIVPKLKGMLEAVDKVSGAMGVAYGASEAIKELQDDSKIGRYTKTIQKAREKEVADAMGRGDWPGVFKATEKILMAGGADTATNMLIHRILTGGVYGQAPGGTGPSQALGGKVAGKIGSLGGGQALQEAGVRAVTTLPYAMLMGGLGQEGDLSDRAKSFMYSWAMVNTPSISRPLGSTKLLKGKEDMYTPIFDVLANQGIDVAVGTVNDAIEDAYKIAEQTGKPEDVYKYTIINLIPSVGANLGFGLTTGAMKDAKNPYKSVTPERDISVKAAIGDADRNMPLSMVNESARMIEKDVGNIDKEAVKAKMTDTLARIQAERVGEGVSEARDPERQALDQQIDKLKEAYNTAEVQRDTAEADRIGAEIQVLEDQRNALAADIDRESQMVRQSVEEQAKLSQDIEGVPKEQALAPVEYPSPREGMGIRKSAERIAKIPEMREQAEAIRREGAYEYDKQNTEQMREDLDALTMTELEARTLPITDPGNAGKVTEGQLNDSVMATLMLSEKLIAEGMDGQAPLTAALKAGTTMGQLINQFKYIKTKTADGLMSILDAGIQKAKADGADVREPNESQRKTAKGLMQNQIDAQNRVEETIEDMRTISADASKEQLAEAQKQYEDALRQQDIANRKLHHAMREMLPAKLSEAFTTALQGSLLTPISLVKNPVGNVMRLSMKTPGDYMASAIDFVRSAATGKDRTTLAPHRVVKEYVKGAAEGFMEGTKELLTGNVDEKIAGERIRAFHPLRDAKEMLTGKTTELGIDLTAKDRLRKGFDALIGVPAEPMLRSLNWLDKPFRRGAERALLTEQGQIQGLKDKELQNYIKFPTREQLKQIEGEALEAVFQQDNKLATWIGQGEGLIKKIPMIGDWAHVVAKTQLPYVKTPTNLLAEGLEYAVPPIALGRALYNEKAGNKRKANQYYGKFLVGQSLAMAAHALANAGLVSPDPSDNKGEKDLQYNTHRPNTLNMSGLKRFLSGGDPTWKAGDQLVATEPFGYIGLIMNMHANRSARLKKEGKEENYTDWLFPTMSMGPEFLGSVFNLSMMKGMYNVMDLIKNSDNQSKVDRWMQNTMNVAISPFAPNTLKALNRATSESIKDYKDDTPGDAIPYILSNSMANTMGNLIRGRYFADRDLPPRYDLFGDPLPSTPEGANPFSYHLVDVFKSQYSPSKPMYTKMLDVLNETGDPKAVAQWPGRNIRVFGIKEPVSLNNAEYRELVKMVGDERKRRFNAKPDDYKWSVKSMKRVWDQGLERGRKKFISQYRQSIRQRLESEGQ